METILVCENILSYNKFDSVGIKERWINNGIEKPLLI